MKYFSGGTTGASCGQRRQSDVFNNFCTKPKCTIVQMQIINGKCHPSWMANGNRKLIHMGVCICMCAYHIFNGSRKLHAYIFIYRDTLLYIHILHLHVCISQNRWYGYYKMAMVIGHKWLNFLFVTYVQ